MFSPKGYTSFAKLWQKFTTKHFVHIYNQSAQDYAGSAARRSFNRGSPADICEHIFLKSFLEHQVVVALDARQVANVDVEIDRQFNSIYTVATAFESKLIVSELLDGHANVEAFQRFGSIRFKPWAFDHDDPVAWNKAYPQMTGEQKDQINIESVQFHTLPYVFERLRFVVPHAPPPWTEGAFHREYVESLIQRFPGSSFCLSDSDVGSWSHSCSTSVAAFFGTDNKEYQPGRPKKLDDVVKAIKQLYPVGFESVSRKEILKQVEGVIGYSVSESTVKRAIKELKDRSKLGSKTT